MQDHLEMRLLSRTHLSKHALVAAAEFASQAADREQPAGEGFDATHRSYVLGAVVFGTVFAESAINEFYVEMTEQTSGLYELDLPTRKKIAALWTTATIDRLSVLDKYQTALLLTNRTVCDAGRQPFQDADLLFRLRNSIVHFKPEWASGEDVGKENLKFMRMLQGRFPSNRLMEGKGNPYFPDHCLGAGCAKWAVNSAYALVHEFHERLGADPRLLATDGCTFPVE